MALPPERISIKRRRLDEPVDTLVLEPGSVQDKKRQFTEFIFQRLRRTTDSKSAEVHATGDRDVGSVPTSAASIGGGGGGSSAKTDRVDEHRALGLPVVKTSKPGEEVGPQPRSTAVNEVLPTTRPVVDRGSSVDNGQRKATTQVDKRAGQDVKSSSDDLGHDGVSNFKEAISDIPLDKIKSARRFHLTRDISSTLRPNSSGGIRRRKLLNLRPPLATFIERLKDRPTKSTGKDSVPVDSIIHMKEENSANILQKENKSELPVIEGKTPIRTFQKATTSVERDGHSIHDDPSTWDIESDRLADELAALAFELDPEAAARLEPEESRAPESKVAPPEPMIVAGDEDDYVFETYIRVRRDVNAENGQVYLGDDFGVLVINEEDHDLWDKYVREDDDDDDDWEEEDEDSNAEDNPRNDYPEDEVSSDDEYGTNVYKYRQNASDDEQYDNESSWRERT